MWSGQGGKSPFQKNMRIEMVIDIPKKGKKGEGTMVLKHAGYSSREENVLVVGDPSSDHFVAQTVKKLKGEKRIVFLLNKSKVKISEQFW